MNKSNHPGIGDDVDVPYRKTSQHLIPYHKPNKQADGYDIYPSFPIPDSRISDHLNQLASIIATHRRVIIDGYHGVFFHDYQERLDKLFRTKGLRVIWHSTSDYLKSESQIIEMCKPFAGGDDPVFGKRTDIQLKDFFRIDDLRALEPDRKSDIDIIIGPGAALSGWKGLIIYIDIPKNEIQYRMRSGSTGNIGLAFNSDPKQVYKRYYFIDWIVLNEHKRKLLPEIDIIADGQHAENLLWMTGDHFRQALDLMSHSPFRVRPWFEPGAWGGTWIWDNITGLNKDVPNYAWSFELIVPENGIVFESSGLLLEVSFDFLMFAHAKEVLGHCFERFRYEFPIRFDFLDTFDGGNLSIQCHPSPDYTKEHFGESFTQEETYYILDAKDNACVYLGFQEEINPFAFQDALEESFRDSKPVDIEKFVQKLPASAHDLFLIPSGTIHGSGKNNLVLEISSTPYIYTFKMYDWLRPDLDGKPRPLNIRRGMDNLCFDRKGEYVRDKLISKPELISEGIDWKLFHLPTHETHLYDVHRYHFTNEIIIETNNHCHVLSLVEGTSIIVETANGIRQRFSFAETFVIPASAKSYRVVNQSSSEAILVKAFVKPI
jgi:mannose-6-phosphate isomerase class I